MSRAEELLNSLDSGETTESTIDEGIIVVNEDRTISVPDSLRRLGVEHDHNIETVTIRCPRFWDGHDMSQMKIYINYLRPDGVKGRYLTGNLKVSGDSMTFDWIISNNATHVKGTLSFLVCIVQVNDDGMEVQHWNSELNQECYISEGMECTENIILGYPDIITHLLLRMEEVESVASPEAVERLTTSWLDENHDRLLAELETKAQEALDSIPPDYTEVYRLSSESVRTRANSIVSNASGEAITLTDSSDDYLRNLKIFGKTTQVKTTGKNLIHNELYTMKTNGLSITVNKDKTFIVSGTASAGTFLTIHTDFNPGAGEYILSGCPVVGGVDKAILYMTDDSGFYAQDAGTGSRFTHPGNIAPDVRLAIYEGTTLNNALFKPMIRSADIEDDTYEPFTGGTAAPNPGYPRELESVNEPIVTITNTNLFGGITMARKINELSVANTSVLDEVAKTVTYSGGGLNAAVLINGVFKPNTRYTLVLYGKNTTATNAYTNITILYDDSTMLVSTPMFDTHGEYSYSVLISETGKTVKAIIGKWASGEVTLQYEKCGLFEGVKSVADFEPYVEQTMVIPNIIHGIPVNSGGNYTDSNGQQWICDEIDFARGVYIQRTMEKVFDGVDGEVITLYSERNSVYGFALKLTDDMLTTSHAARCSHFENIETGISSVDRECFLCGAGSKTIYVMINKDRISDYSIEAFKVWLYDNPITILFQLAEPVESSLTADELEAFKWYHTNRPNTTILNDSGAYMELEYNADTQVYLEQLPKATDAQVQAAVDAWLAANFTAAEGVGF